jgi:hypothetical protein
MTSAYGEMSARLQSITEELKDLERDLRLEHHPDPLLVQNFRDALDSSRTTAWTITELLRARQSEINPQMVLSFLFAERIRRFTQMTKDLSADMQSQSAQFQPDGINALSGALELLQSQLSRLARK